MKPELVIFDMDGTLADTSPGIIASFMSVAHEFDLPEPPVEKLYGFIGGTLADNLGKIYGLDRDDSIRAAQVFRDYYATTGYLSAKLYPGMEETIRTIHDMGIALGVATMKLDEYAKQLVVQWGLADLFVDVCGADAMGALSKSDLIDRCIYAAGTSPSRTLMVGDTVNDFNGARQSGTDFVAVTYGYGFTPDVCIANRIKFAETAGGVLEFI